MNCRFAMMICSLVVCAATCHGAHLRTVALTGQQAPGLPVSFSLESFGYALLDANGRVSFSAELREQGIQNGISSSIWSEESGALALLARTGDQAPGFPSDVQFSLFGDFAVSTAGHTAFPADIRGTGEDETLSYGIWSGHAGSLTTVLQGGSQAPGLPDGMVVHFDTDPPVNSSGRTAIHVVLVGEGVSSENNEGIWSDATGAAKLIAREGDHAPGLPSEINFGRLDLPAINSAGQVAFYGELSRGGIGDTSFWLADANTLALVARTGDHAPGTPDGVSFNRVGRLDDGPALNSLGQVAFHATLSGVGVGDTNNNGIWSGGINSLRLVARAGSQAPGTSEDVIFRKLYSAVINSDGKTAFGATLTGVGVDSGQYSLNNQGIWSEGFGSLALVAREGDQAPGTPDGMSFGNFDSAHPMLNSAGQVAFESFFGLNGMSDGRGIWAQDRVGTLRLIINTGGQIEVAPGDFRTVAALESVCCTTADEGHFNPFNELGQLAFRARFTDGSEGIFVSSIAAVPEPTALFLLFVTLATVGNCRRPFPSFAARIKTCCDS
jgi:hypothetical protein